MKVKTYLSQAHRLDEQINADIREVDQLRKLSQTISSPGLEEQYNASRNTEAPFVRQVEKIALMEDAINAEIDKLVDLKVQTREAINSVEDPDERMVLQYRYLQNMSWAEIGKELYAGVTTVRRWHDKALADVTMPLNPIRI